MKSLDGFKAFAYGDGLAVARCAVVTVIGLFLNASYGNDLVQEFSNTQVVALERVVKQIRDHKNEIKALTSLMRDQLFEMPTAGICAKLVLPPPGGIPQSSLKILELRKLMQHELDELEKLIDLTIHAVSMFPGIENKVLLPYRYELRALLKAGLDLQVENILREVTPLHRLAVDPEESPDLREEIVIEFPRSGRKMTLRPHDHLTISFTNTDETGKGVVRQSDPDWKARLLIMSTDSADTSDNGFFSVGVSYIKSVTIRHLDGTIEVIESGEPSDRELREAAKTPEGLQKLRERLRPRAYPKTLENARGN